MDVSSFNSSCIALSSNIPRSHFMFGTSIKVRSSKRYGVPRKLHVLHCRAQASGITKVGVEAASRDANFKDRDLVFVAGATGRVGSRTVRELLKLGFKVRAGVRNKSRAESLVQIVRQMKLNDASSGGNQAIEKLDIVECDLEKPDQIGPALGKASIVICCIGASEKEIFDITGPYRIDYMATKNLIDAATIEKVDHFILLTSLGTNKIGFPAAILNLFWGVLCWKRKAEEALIASGLPYSIVRPGGMERPTDSYKLTHNITLSEEDTLFGGQVSNLQVAELMACMARNRRISYCKVLEVIAETTAPLTPMEDLLAKIPSQRIEILPYKESSDADEPSPFVSESGTSEPSTPSFLEETSPAKPAPIRALSPYTAYEDLKPPTTPSPTPSSKTGDFKANLETLLPISNSQPSAVESDSLESSDPVTETGSLKKEGKHSSSPYTNYPDLKPPVSPTPNKPGMPKDTRTPKAATSDSESNKTVEIVADSSEPKPLAGEQLISFPLSPYTAYEDLKPPSSPSPTSSGPQAGSSAAFEISDSTPQITRGDDQANTGTGLVETDSPPSSTASHSPYQAYEDLKPPSSPSPNAPVIPENGGIVAEQNPSSTQHQSVSKQYTLSPFTMYEELKPPSSPSPSFREL